MEIFALILPIILEFLVECRETRSRADIEAGLRDPGLREVIACRRAIRAETKLRRRPLREAVSDCMRRLKDLPSAAITAAMDEVEAEYLEAREA